MSIMRLVYIAFVMLFTMPTAWATTYSGAVYWSSTGQLAANCSITLPDEQPLAVPRTLIVSNDIPNDTEIFSWGYGEFLSDVTMSCTSSGNAGTTSSTTGFSPLLSLNTMMGYGSLSGSATNLSGLRLYLWLRANTSSSPCTGSGCVGNYYSLADAAAKNSLAADEEVDLNPSTIDRQWYQKMNPQYSASKYTFTSFTGSYSIRASLVKISNVSYGSLNIPNPPRFNSTDAGTVMTMFSGSGITIAPPACQLKTKDYTIPMGLWAADTINYVGSPAYGSQVPVNLSLECSGKVDHVRFRFEDTGTSVSSNNNITLYDSIGGDKIDGLEIELQYNGSKANVNNTDLTDTGSHGSYVSTDDVFDSASTAAFTARYVQNGTITRNGANYTGPVTGKVNMYVTYD